MAKEATRFSLSVEPGLLLEFDETTKSLGYNRSSAIQHAMRDFLSEKRWTMEEDIVAGVITMLYNHDIKGLIETVKRLEHSYLTQICSTTHIHFETGDCVEILAVRGESKHIKDLTRELAIIRGVKQIKLAVLSP